MNGNLQTTRSWTARLAAAHDAVTRAGFIGAALCLAVITGSYCYEIVARYFFSAPTVWAGALVSYALCAMVFLTMPELTRQRAHIVLTLLQNFMSDQSASVLRRVVCVAAGVACMFAAWFIAHAIIGQYQQDVHTISAWPIPKWPLSTFIVYGMFSSSVHFLRQVMNDAPAESSMAAVS